MPWKRSPQSRVREVHLVGRRGPVQAKFTPPELRELGQLQDCDPIVDPDLLTQVPGCYAELDARPDARRNVKMLLEYSRRTSGHKRRRLVIDFLKSPVRLRGTRNVEAVVLEKNRLEGDTGQRRAVGTGQKVDIPCGLFFRSIGYWCYSIPFVPYDANRGIIPNARGRVIDEQGRALPGLYAAGWIKRGPTGMIGTNRADAVETVTSLLEDFEDHEPCEYDEREAVDELLTARGQRIVTYDDWKRIDAAEVLRGQAVGKPREKGTTVAELLGFLER